MAGVVVSGAGLVDAVTYPRRSGASALLHSMTSSKSVVETRDLMLTWRELREVYELGQQRERHYASIVVDLWIIGGIWA